MTGEPTTALDGARAAPPAFEALVAAERDRIARLVFRLLGWSSDAEDVVQEVFLAALRNLRRFRGESAVSTWLVRIAINKCRSQTRSLRVRIRALADAARRVRGRSVAGPDERAMRLEVIERVRRAIRALPARDREAIVLRYLEGLTPEETASVLGIRRAAADVRLHRARRRLRDALGDLMEE